MKKAELQGFPGKAGGFVRGQNEKKTMVCYKYSFIQFVFSVVSGHIFEIKLFLGISPIFQMCFFFS